MTVPTNAPGNIPGDAASDETIGKRHTLLPDTREIVTDSIEKFKRNGMVLGVAESCTGGLLSGACTSMPGSSSWFVGGVVSYSDSVKEKILGVPRELISRHGAVSLPVVRAMALGVKKLLNTDCSIAVSGIAGPGGWTAEKPVGTVCFAWAFAHIAPELAFQLSLKLEKDTVSSASQGILPPLLSDMEYNLEYLPAGPANGAPETHDGVLLVTQQRHIASRAEDDYMRRTEVRVASSRVALLALAELTDLLY